MKKDRSTSFNSTQIGKIVCHKYKILKFLNKGTYGKIYLAEN